jgi:hypothetical protein
VDEYDAETGIATVSVAPKNSLHPMFYASCAVSAIDILISCYSNAGRPVWALWVIGSNGSMSMRYLSA